jgi:hypothetical protein
MLCSLGGGGLSGHLPRTGTQEWVLPGVRDLVMINHDRMVVTDDFSGGNNYLVDPATGRAVGAPVAGRLVADQRPGGAPLVLRPTDDPPGRLAVVALDPADGGRHTLGTVPVLTVDDRCSATTGYLACVRAVGGTSTLEITAVG